jgi:hypothetical protein
VKVFIVTMAVFSAICAGVNLKEAVDGGGRDVAAAVVQIAIAIWAAVLLA